MMKKLIKFTVPGRLQKFAFQLFFGDKDIDLCLKLTFG